MQTPNEKATQSTFLATLQSRKLNLLEIALGVLVMLGLGIIIGYYLRGNKQVATQNGKLAYQIFPTISQSPNKNDVSPMPNYATIFDKQECSKEECLYFYDDSYMGFTTLKGYYKKYDIAKSELYPEPISCDSLLIIGGGKKNINSSKKSVEAGNGINTIIDNNLLVTIDLTDLTSIEKSLIEQSSPTNLVELGVITDSLGEGRMVERCFSAVDIVSVKSITN